MKKVISSFLLLVFVAAANVCAFAQAGAGRCESSAGSPLSIHGLSLGTRYEDVSAMFPDSEGFRRAPEVNEMGAVDPVTIGPADLLKSPDRFGGVRAFAFSFVDGRLATVSVVYHESQSWPAVEDFARQVSRTLGVPAAWRQPKDADPQYTLEMNCGTYKVAAHLGMEGPSHFMVLDTLAVKTVRDRAARMSEARAMK